MELTLTLIMAAFAIPAIVGALVHLREERRLEWLRDRMQAEDRLAGLVLIPRRAMDGAGGGAAWRSRRLRAG